MKTEGAIKNRQPRKLKKDEQHENHQKPGSRPSCSHMGKQLKGFCAVVSDTVVHHDVQVLLFSSLALTKFLYVPSLLFSETAKERHLNILL